MGFSGHLNREIGVFTACLLVVNALIGSAIFGLPGILADQTGMFLSLIHI